MNMANPLEPLTIAVYHDYSVASGSGGRFFVRKGGVQTEQRNVAHGTWILDNKLVGPLRGFHLTFAHPISNKVAHDFVVNALKNMLVAMHQPSGDT